MNKDEFEKEAGTKWSAFVTWCKAHGKVTAVAIALIIGLALGFLMRR